MNNSAMNGNNSAMNIWDNPANYKRCVKKQYEIWVCQPPQGTVVINKLEQADSVAMCRGKTVFTPYEIERNPQIKALCEKLVGSGKAYIVNNPQNFVLSGTRGELWCIKGDKLAKKYVWASDNTPINAQTLKSRLGDVKYLGWQKVRTVPDNSVAFACFVPAKIQGQIQTSWAVLNINGRGVSHGKGDFVISQPGADGKPSASRYVVNGAVFADTYDNRGWQDCLIKQSSAIAEKPSELFNSRVVVAKCTSEIVMQARSAVSALSKKYPEVMKAFSPVALKGLSRTLGNIDVRGASVIPFVYSSTSLDDSNMNDVMTGAKVDMIVLSNGKAYFRDVNSNNVVDLNAPDVNKLDMLKSAVNDFENYIDDVDVAQDMQWENGCIEHKGWVRPLAWVVEHMGYCSEAVEAERKARA